MKISCIIIDDEPFAQKLLQEYVDKIPILDLKGVFVSPIEAVPFLNQNNIDLIFLDIEMPNITGLEFSKMVSESTKIIFTTAYSSYAVKSYEVKALDYLVKPINFNRFLSAVYKYPSKK